MRESACLRFVKYTFLFFIFLFLQSVANATHPDDVNFCGGLDQRACCFFEASPSCDGSYYEEIGGATCNDGISTFNTGICRSNNPNDKAFCGGNGQRACCLSEAISPCDTGTIQLAIVASGNETVCGGLPAGTCWTPTDCGGEGERACTVLPIFEQFPSCDEGLIELAGCNGIECGYSLGWCSKPTDCGGEGQRACCVLEQIPSCDPGLTERPGVAGDATCGTGGLPTASLGTCVNMGTLKTPIAEPGTGWSSEGSTDQTCESKGYADLHVHMFAHLAHGGGVLSGTPYDATGGVNKALRMDYGTDLDLVKSNGGELLPSTACDPTIFPFCGNKLFHFGHLITDDAVGVGTHEGPPHCLGLACGAGSNFGSPVFNGWPTWRSTTHQQVYYKWLERAWRGGLRLMGQLAVTNEALCKGSKRLRDTNCEDEMAPVNAQIDATYEFQTYVDNLSGGAGMGWFRIVTTPSQARQVISDGKLAVVLGIEVANLFNCKKDGCSGKNLNESDIDYVKRKVDEYYDKGVRIIFPIHNFDNAFGGPATWQNAINAGNKISEGAYWNPEDCPGGYGFKVGAFSSWVISFLGFGISGIVPINDGDASCNSDGLTPLGVYTVTYMMQKGIIVDVDHLSRKSFDDTLNIADSVGRPVIASHVQFFDLNKEETRHERMRTAEQLERIRATGGMVAAMLKDDTLDTDNVTGKFNVPYTTSPSGKVIKDDCRYSSKTWAQMYQYAVDKMQGPVAMGSDFNGVAGHVGPRFGYDACGINFDERSAQGRAGNKLQYPFILSGFGKFSEQKTGLRTFDFNVDGLAHIGLLPDMVADLKKIGMSDVDLEPLMESASGFVTVWDRANGTVAPPNQITQLGCESKTVEADSNCQASEVSIANAETLADFGGNLTQIPAGPYNLGQTSVALSTTQLDICGAQPGSCTSPVTVVDNTAPPITCPQSVTKECAGATTVVQFTAPVVGNDNCGVSLFEGCTSASGTGFLKGNTQVTCSSKDDANLDFGGPQAPNTDSCNFDINVTDTTLPKIVCPDNITKECTGNRSAPADPGVATATDVCAGVEVTTNEAGSFPVGTTPLTYTATDEAGLVASCDTNITVQDTTLPQISCPAQQTLECTGNSSAPGTPSAASSSDICGAVNVSQPPAAIFPMGTTPLTYIATDQENLTASCLTSIKVQDTTPPQITCPPTKTVECTGNHSAPVTPAAATGSDICAGVSFTGPAAGSYPLGSNPVTYKVTDQVGLNASCSTAIVVQDTTPPTISSVSVYPSVLESLWPANHKMKLVTLQVVSTDICDTVNPPVSPVCHISSITSNEPIDGLGDGDTAPDWQILAPLQANLRAERSGTGTGRIYTLQVTCSDQAGNNSVGSTTVIVPHNQ